jgi:hypothetical protein
MYFMRVIDEHQVMLHKLYHNAGSSSSMFSPALKWMGLPRQHREREKVLSFGQ